MCANYDVMYDTTFATKSGCLNPLLQLKAEAISFKIINVLETVLKSVVRLNAAATIVVLLRTNVVKSAVSGIAKIPNASLTTPRLPMFQGMSGSV